MSAIPTVELFRTIADGTIRLRNTRITLETIVARYQQGDSAEAIHEGFPTLSVEDIEAVINHYLAHQEEVDEYIARQDAEAEAIWQQIETNYTPEQRARTEYFRSLLAHKKQQSDNS